MNIAVIMSGIIKRYEHLEDLKDVFASTESRFNFKIFGQCYDFLGNPRRCRDQIEYGAEEKLDMNYLSNYYTKIKYIKGSEFEKYDNEGFSNRIVSQWQNIKDGVILAEEYEKETGVKFDMIIRARPDISINKKMLFEIIEASSANEKIYYRSDCVIVGPADKMSKVLRLVDHYYEYHALPVFKEKTEAWVKKNVNRNRVRSNAESERLLAYHIAKLFGSGFKVTYPRKFNEILRN